MTQCKILQKRRTGIHHTCQYSFYYLLSLLFELVEHASLRSGVNKHGSPVLSTQLSAGEFK